MHLGVIFDVDGVIIDVSNSYHYCIKETAQSFLKKELDIHEVRRLKFESGINNDYLATLYVIRHFGKDANLEDVIRTFDNTYKSLRDKERLILNHDFFKSLKEKNLKLGVLTGRPRQDLTYAFERFDLFKYFDCIVDDDTIEHPNLRKPHPYALYFCISSMNLSKAVYIGDSLSDYKMWVEYKNLHKQPLVTYIHFGSNTDIQGVVKARNQEELTQALQEVLQTP